MIVIVGESASGKSTLAKYLMDVYGYKRIITYTTRPIRNNEKDGIDYYYITKECFETIKNNDFFAETANYNGWLYGSAKEDYKDDSVVVLTPRGLRALKVNGIENIFSVYINIPRRDRLIKCLERGDDIEEAYRRNLSDLGQFDGIEDEVNLVINNPKYYMNVEEIADIIMEQKDKV